MIFILIKKNNSFRIFENQGNEVPIEIFLKEIGIPDYKHPIIKDWWYKQ